jgi:hypothetical protein
MAVGSISPAVETGPRYLSRHPRSGGLCYKGAHAHSALARGRTFLTFRLMLESGGVTAGGVSA